MKVFEGEFYCVLSEINSKNYKICSRQWLKIDFKSGSAETIFQIEYDKFDNIQNAYSTTLTVSNNKMLTVTTFIHEIVVFDVYSQSIDRIVSLTEVPVNYAEILSGGRVIYSDILNRIYITDENRNSRQIYEADTAGSIYELSVKDDGFCMIRDTCTDKYLISSDNIYSGQINFIPADLSNASVEVSEYSDTFDSMFFMYCAAGVAVGIIVFALVSLKRFPVLLKIAVILILCLGIGSLVYTYKFHHRGTSS